MINIIVVLLKGKSHPSNPLFGEPFGHTSPLGCVFHHLTKKILKIREECVYEDLISFNNLEIKVSK